MVRVWKGDISSQEDFNSARAGFAVLLVDSMKTSGLDDKETFQCAKVLSWAGRNERAEELLAPLAGGDDDLARQAAVQLVTMKIEDGLFERAELMMMEFRSRFPPDPAAETDLYFCVDDIAGRYNDADRVDDAIRVITDELESLPFDYPYRSFFFIEELVPLMIETDGLPELRELIASHRERFGASLAAHLALPAPHDSIRAEYDKLAAALEKQGAYLGDLLDRLDLVGARAPVLQLAHVYNADSVAAFESLWGSRVTVLDFWATGRLACVVGYREMGAIYADYRERGLEIVGVTGFQGRFRDSGTGVWEGSDDDPLEPGREIELTGEYIEKHDMVWPCAIREGSIMDGEYAIKGLPTYFILDGRGVIRYMQIGIGKQRQMRRVIERLLEEI